MNNLLIKTAALLAVSGGGAADESGIPKNPTPDIMAVEDRLIETTAGKLAVYELGQGTQTIVFWPSIFADRSIYRQIIPSFTADYRVILVEGPGHGRSGSASQGTGVAGHAAALSEVMDALGVRRAALVGTSWGGMVAGELGLSTPERVAGIAFLNTPFYLGQETASRANRRIVRAGKLMLGSRVYINGVARSFFSGSTRENDKVAMRLFAEHLRRADRRSLMDAVGSVLLSDAALAPRLPSLTVPSLVVAGRNDAMYPLSEMQKAADSIPHSRFVVLESNHISPVDDPEGTVRALLPFLKQLEW